MLEAQLDSGGAHASSTGPDDGRTKVGFPEAGTLRPLFGASDYRGNVDVCVKGSHEQTQTLRKRRVPLSTLLFLRSMDQFIQ